MQVLIIEDEYPSALRLQKMLQQVAPEMAVQEIFATVKETVIYLQGNRTVDLLFLDIELADGIGLEILTQVNRSIPVIFTTAYEEYALEAFQYLSVDYLLKPIKKMALERSIEKYRQNFSQQKTVSTAIDRLKELLHPTNYATSFIGRIGKNHYPLLVENIAYCYIEERETWIMTKSGKEYTLAKTMEQLGDLLSPDDFFRANRRLICAKLAIAKFKILEKSKISLILRPEPTFSVQISSEKSAAFKQWIGG